MRFFSQKELSFVNYLLPLHPERKKRNAEMAQLVEQRIRNA